MSRSDDSELPHPRETSFLFGHERVERNLATAFLEGRLHHALILSGPRGIGKASLAYRLAAFVLAGGADGETLDIGAGHPVRRRIMAGSEPDLAAIQDEGEGARASGALLVEDVRRITHFFETTAAGAAWRVAIIDPAEAMNNAAANALLKTLEEPPANCLLVLVSHAPGRLPSTIRSRCLLVPMAPLSPSDLRAAAREATGNDLVDGKDMELVARLSEGSLRRALELARHDGLDLYRQMTSLLDRLPQIDLAAAHAFAERFSPPQARAAFTLAVDLLLVWIAARMRATALPGSAGLSAFAPAPGNLARWAEVWEKTARAAALADTYNLDRKHVLFSAMTDLAEAARA